MNDGSGGGAQLMSVADDTEMAGSELCYMISARGGRH